MRAHGGPLGPASQGSKSGTPDAGKTIYRLPPSQLCYKKWSLRPQNGLERRVWQFFTICDKIQLLKVKIEKVTVILVLRSWDASCWAISGFAEKFVWGSMVK
jgi:hypothetical protein